MCVDRFDYGQPSCLRPKVTYAGNYFSTKHGMWYCIASTVDPQLPEEWHQLPGLSLAIDQDGIYGRIKLLRFVLSTQRHTHFPIHGRGQQYHREDVGCFSYVFQRFRGHRDSTTCDIPKHSLEFHKHTLEVDVCKRYRWKSEYSGICNALLKLRVSLHLNGVVSHSILRPHV